MESFVKALVGCLTGMTDDANEFVGEKGHVDLASKWEHDPQDVAAEVIQVLYEAEEKGRDLEYALQDIVWECGWTQNIAIAVLHGLENALKREYPMGKALKEAFERSTSAAIGFAREHPVYCTIIALGILVALAPWALEALGFGLEGPLEGSFAAWWQARYAGYVPKRSLFAFFQRLEFSSSKLRRAELLGGGMNKATMRDLSRQACWRCMYRLQWASRPNGPASRRGITQQHHRRTAEAKKQWDERAEAIRSGQQKSMLSILEERGYIDTIAGSREALDDAMTSRRVGAYVGIDPTAPSMHLGNLLVLMPLFWMYVHGFSTASVLGGASAKIGDPTGRLHRRSAVESHVRKAYMVNIHYQLKSLWVHAEKQANNYGYLWEWAWRRGIVNNNEWMNKLPLMEFLQLLGSGARLGKMLGRETVQRRMKEGDGMSFAEFTYPLIQAWDWWQLYKSRGITIQIGGADQFGNIVAGIDGVKHIIKNHPDPGSRQEKEDPHRLPYGFTVPLLTTASGEKYGKSAGNAIWLSAELTPPFDFYQFFLRLPDSEVERYLKLFTFLPLSQIETVMKEHTEDPSQRRAHHLLAREVATLVHGAPEAKKAELQHRSVFNRTGSQFGDEGIWAADGSEQAPHTTSTNAPPPNIQLPRSLVVNQPPARVMYSAGLVSSRSEANRLLTGRGAYIGARMGDGKINMGDSLTFRPIQTWEAARMEEHLVDGKLLILRVGKWKVKIVQVVDDEEFDRQGLDAPLWQETKEEMARKQAKEAKWKGNREQQPQQAEQLGQDEGHPKEGPQGELRITGTASG